MVYRNLGKSALRLRVGRPWHTTQRLGSLRLSSTQTPLDAPTPSDTPASSTQSSSNSIFESGESTWDHVFRDIDTSPSALLASTSFRRKEDSMRRYGMTAREVNAFDEMFQMLFSAVSEEKQQEASQRLLGPSTGIGRSPQRLGDLAAHLRHRSKSLRWSNEADQELDLKKEGMDKCTTDQQLLAWAMREVFGESQRYEEQTRSAMAASSSTRDLHLQPPSYPKLIALLMSTFRDKYGDPHLALSIFDHARHLSVASFVFGCTTPAYNELIDTRWRCFRDIRGVCDALEEMRVNGVEMDNRTRSLVETVRRGVGERNLWEEESSLGSGEVWGIVKRIEQLTARDKPRHKRTARNDKNWKPERDSWKRDALKDDPHDDGWEFGQWEENPAPRDT